MNNKVKLFLDRLQQAELSLALAESITCGLAAHKLSTNPGTGAVFKGAIVCYTEEVKTRLLKVPQKLIDRYTSESMEVTEALSKNLGRVIKADIYGAITGLGSAGGSETKTKPVGTVFFCVKYGNTIFKEKKVFRGTPLEIREKACDGLYDLITRKILLKKNKI